MKLYKEYYGVFHNSFYISNGWNICITMSLSFINLPTKNQILNFSPYIMLLSDSFLEDVISGD